MTTKHVNLRLSPEMHNRLVDMAERKHRSLNGQIETYIERGLAADETYSHPSRGRFAYITNPAARAYAEANEHVVSALIADVIDVVGWQQGEIAAVTAWTAAYGHPGNAEEQQREIHFQLMSHRHMPPSRELSEALDRALAPHLPLPAADSRPDLAGAPVVAARQVCPVDISDATQTTQTTQTTGEQ